jgi:hypothetical protein
MNTFFFTRRVEHVELNTNTSEKSAALYSCSSNGVYITYRVKIDRPYSIYIYIYIVVVFSCLFATVIRSDTSPCFKISPTCFDICHPSAEGHNF